MAKATNVNVGLQSGTSGTLYATWTWSKSNTDHYTIQWKYGTGDGIWFVGESSDVRVKQCTYSIPSNAKSVMFRVKPVSKTHKVNNKDTRYWTADWSTYERIDVKDVILPETPSAPSVAINKYKLTAEIDIYDTVATRVRFQVIKNDKTTWAIGEAAIRTKHASYSCNVEAGGTYKVRCCAYTPLNARESGWSNYSANVGTIPAAIEVITECKALSDTSVKLAWTKASNTFSYEIEYATKKDYFNSSNEVQNTTSNTTHAEIIGLDPGEEWFFRVRAVNDQGESGWSPIVSTVIGKAPSAPTTWSSTTTANVGEIVRFFWTHNAEDGSDQTCAEVEITEDKGIVGLERIAGDGNSYSINTSRFSESSTVYWRVRTKGILDKFSDYSAKKMFRVYAPPTLTLGIGDNGGSSVLTSFPLVVNITCGPATQKAIGYYLSIISKETYETVDQIGNVTIIKAGDEVYSKYFNALGNNLSVRLTPGDVNLDNNISYTVMGSVTMNSGLTAEASTPIAVAWKDEEYEPDAEIGYSADSYTTHIRPYCEDADGNPINNVDLAVYRREFDGSFTELAKELDNSIGTFITDPHPALDYARYRIVATSRVTGAVSYYDVPGFPIGEKAVIIQWDEEWSSFDTDNEDEHAIPVWAGSLLRLPYNIDVSDSYNQDVSLIEYIGRKHPVSYYGTQMGSTATWSVEIIKTDEETLYALRRLAIWPGDVYVREPSGSGYWAQVKVSFNQKYNNLTIPVTLDITRVDGGV